jgi:hypothetical protein
MTNNNLHQLKFDGFGFSPKLTINYQLDIPQLIEKALLRGEGKLAT